MFRYCFITISTFLIIQFPGRAEETTPFRETLIPLLDSYCLDCHDSLTAKADVDMEAILTLPGAMQQPKVLRRMIDQLEAGLMPPPDRKTQPTDEERLLIEETLQGALDRLAGLTFDPGRSTVRRLNRTQYNNTVRDLFGVTTEPAHRFPKDGAGGGGFDNNGDTLFLPPILFEKYLEATDEILNEIFGNEALLEKFLFIKPDETLTEEAVAQTVMSYHAGMAYRRPVKSDEMDRLMSLYRSAREEGQDFPEALRRPLKAVLLSPHFIFCVEEDRESEEPWRITDYELATRLSYFLWSSAPDTELRELAHRRKLSDPEVLESQVIRMLADPKAEALAINFGGQWMEVEKLRLTAEPDRRTFRSFNRELRESMAREMELFFDDLLRNNGSLLDIIRGDYSFLNGQLAEHYGIEGIEGEEFRRVVFEDPNRGGVLGMGSFLTATSLPLRTSPVLRGKWILEQLLGNPPPPPPANVGEIPNDRELLASSSLRELLENHRNKPACMGCHSRMDPLGFSLENFDAIGRWRTEENGKAIDSTGEMKDGTTFSGPAELKGVLMERQDLFARNLSAQILAFALGRGIEYYDESTVKDLMTILQENEFRSLPLILGVVRSYPFQHRRNTPLTLPSL